MKEFIVTHDWDYESNFTECDTIEEAVTEQQAYVSGEHHIYQRVHEDRIFTGPNGERYTQHIS